MVPHQWSFRGGTRWNAVPIVKKNHQNSWERRSHTFWRFRRKINWCEL